MLPQEGSIIVAEATIIKIDFSATKQKPSRNVVAACVIF
jgi:hypothetical protein